MSEAGFLLSVKNSFDRPSATVLADRNLNIIHISDSYFELYGLDGFDALEHYIDLVRSRLSAGWFSISEVFSSKDPCDYALDRVMKNEYFRDFHVSREGVVIDATHCVDRKREIVSFDFIPTNMKISASSDLPVPKRALIAVRDLSALPMFGAFPNVRVFQKSNGREQAEIIACASFGRVLVVDEEGCFPELSRIESFSDMSLEVSEVVDAIESDGFYLGSFDFSPDQELNLELVSESFYVGGPSIILGRVTRGYGGISTEMIQDNFRKLTRKEAEVICLLARGYSLKECAGLTGKAQATVTLQARKAVRKTGEQNIRHLLAKIYQL